MKFIDVLIMLSEIPMEAGRNLLESSRIPHIWIS
jgi:hypothetical protein